MLTSMLPQYSSKNDRTSCYEVWDAISYGEWRRSSTCLKALELAVDFIPVLEEDKVHLGLIAWFYLI